MSHLNRDWEPGFGSVVTWFAMDKNGKIAVMINNGFGHLPKALLLLESVNDVISSMNEYIWEESTIFKNYPPDKNGQVILDMYSSFVYHYVSSRSEVEKHISDDLIASQNYSDSNLSANKGFFLYLSIEGCCPEDDYPVGYDGETKMGDYFRYLMPTVYASINDFPEELRHGVVVSETIDFTADRLLDNNKINQYFPKMYKR